VSVDSAPAFTAGDSIGAYLIVGLLGIGGMGEVYRARDTKLGRDVAIKILPRAFVADPVRLSRFEREARVLASLSHPGIAAIYGLEEAGDTRALVLELADGDTLAERLDAGPLPVEQALRLALQIAEALEVAHEKGIVHRDLKPANLKVTREGRISILDFGLAKAAAGADAVATLGASEIGLVLGTPAYMSPEQARAEAVGASTDIWAFGAVLYELLTGVSPFAGGSAADTLARIITSEPDLARLPASAPPGVRILVRRCLEKDQRHRFRHIGDVRIQIEELLAPAAHDLVSASIRPTGARPRTFRTLTALALAGAAAAGTIGWFASRPSPPEAAAGAAKLSISFVEPLLRQPFGIRHLAISDDGTRIAYAARSRLWVRRLDEWDAVAIAEAGIDPFFSPDGEWVGFFQEPQLVKVPAAGGPSSIIALEGDRWEGGTWGPDGTIVFATSEGLYRISENGGDELLLAAPDRTRNERFYAWPQFMPDGKSILFTIVRDGPIDGAQIAFMNLDSRETRIVLTGGSAARYLATGHLVYASRSTLKAVAFDAKRGQLMGEAVTLPVEIGATEDNAAADFAVSESGTLVYLTDNRLVSGDLQSGRGLRTLSWIDRHGVEEPLAFEPATYGYPTVSPDGRRAAVELFTGGNRDIWILNLERLTFSRLTDGPTEDLLPLWTRDGTRLFFASNRAGNMDIYSQAADGAAGARVEFSGPGTQFASDFTPDGHGLFVYENFSTAGIVDLDRPERLEPLFHDRFDRRLIHLSPDGHWIAYESNESGDRFEIFLRPFPDVESRREQVSIAGGRYPRWAPDGAELFYVNLDGDMMAVPVTLRPDLVLGRPATLFRWVTPPPTVSFWPYSISPADGRFLTARNVADDDTGQTQVLVVLNFIDELRTRIPRP
jgi:Tol biopolymer transport system component